MSNLLPIIKAAIFGRNVFKYDQGDRITMESVESVLANGKAQVRGVIVPITGVATVAKGEQVAVAWKKGVPVAIIKHRSRRAQTHPQFRKGGGIVEQLVIANPDKTKNDVWYRNGTKCVKVLVSTVDDFTGRSKTVSVADYPGLQGATPQDVKWGLDGKSFGVQCTDGVYAVFDWFRYDPNKYEESFPDAARFCWMDRPLEAQTTLTSVTFTSQVRKTYTLWIGKCSMATQYFQARQNWFDGPYYYWWTGMGKVEQGWETTLSLEGNAAISASKTFTLSDVLKGKVVDWYGNNQCTGSVLEWFVDNDQNMKFLIQVNWDYFWIGTNETGHGTLTIPVGYGPYGMDSHTENIQVGPGGVGCIGAKRQSDHLTVPETHVFLYDAYRKAVTWATAANDPMFGAESVSAECGILEHNIRTDPGYDNSGLPDPHLPGRKDPSETESYYRGANWSNLPVTHYTMRTNIGLNGGNLLSSTGTYQLFDPGRLSCIKGPYGSRTTGVDGYWIDLLGGFTAEYTVTYGYQTGGLQRLWHYRMQYAKVFSRRKIVSIGGGKVGTAGNDEALMFLVVERYPFINGTGYINDLPMLWVGVVDLLGRVILTLRDWQYGLAMAELQTANGHELVYMVATGALDPKPAYYVYNWDSTQETLFENQFGEDMQFTGEVQDQLRENDIAFLLEANAKLFTPNFLWSYRVPEKFFIPQQLPILKEDVGLEPFAHLVGTEASGSTRMINDAELLEPLGKWQAS